MEPPQDHRYAHTCATVRSAASAMTGGSLVRCPGGHDGGGGEAHTGHPHGVHLLLGPGPLSGATSGSAYRGRGLISHDQVK